MTPGSGFVRFDLDALLAELEQTDPGISERVLALVEKIKARRDEPFGGAEESESNRSE